jgi:hypothetical protein
MDTLICTIKAANFQVQTLVTRSAGFSQIVTILLTAVIALLDCTNVHMIRA